MCFDKRRTAGSQWFQAGTTGKFWGFINRSRREKDAELEDARQPKDSPPIQIRGKLVMGSFRPDSIIRDGVPVNSILSALDRVTASKMSINAHAFKRVI